MIPTARRMMLGLAFKATALNPAAKSSSITLSNNNLLATRAGGAVWAGVRSVAALPAGSKKFFSAKMTNAGTNNSAGIALSNATASLDLYGGATTNGVTYAGNTGTVLLNGSSLGTVGTWTVNDIIDMAVDLTAMKIWLRKNGGNWNNNVAHDPATGAGGFSIAGLAAGPYYARLDVYNGSAMLANFGGPFTYSPPSGFSLISA